MNIMDLFKLL